MRGKEGEREPREGEKEREKERATRGKESLSQKAIAKAFPTSSSRGRERKRGKETFF